MKRIAQITRWGGRAAVLGLAWAIAGGSVQAAETRPLTETGHEYVVTSVAPGSLPQEIFKQAREKHGAEVWSGVLHQFIENNVGGKGSVVGFETVHLDASMPTGRIVFGWRSAVMANASDRCEKTCHDPLSAVLYCQVREMHDTTAPRIQPQEGAEGTRKHDF